MRQINAFHATTLSLSERDTAPTGLLPYGDFRGYRKRPVAWHIFQLLTSFAKSSIFDVRLGSEPTSTSGLLREDTT